ncbi:MAG TPA: NUDIX domain-containing protein [Woeseiaceae bacterium]|nr:NUDIX domain-containing protein [Woeseiaceae bacterium]
MPIFEYDRAGIAAVITPGDGRYLMQLRDDKPGLLYPGYTCLFGGAIEAGESASEALLRELYEELRFRPTRFSYLTEIVYPRMVDGIRQFVHDTHFLIRATAAEIGGMELHEGAAMELLTLQQIVARKVVPWDVCGLLYADGT